MRTTVLLIFVVALLSAPVDCKRKKLSKPEPEPEPTPEATTEFTTTAATTSFITTEQKPTTNNHITTEDVPTTESGIVTMKPEEEEEEEESATEAGGDDEDQTLTPFDGTVSTSFGTYTSTGTGTSMTSSYGPSEAATTERQTEMYETTRYLSTESPRYTEKHYRCPPYQYACKYRRQCIGLGSVCDGRRDCLKGDDEDEEMCAGLNQDEAVLTTLSCSDGQISCRVNNEQMCLPEFQICDGMKDCADGADEQDCPAVTCRHGQWKCNDGRKCIAPTQYCNQVKDCFDNSDEKNCVYDKCGFNEYSCRSGECIPEEFKCDNYPDCIDGSDEWSCV